MNGTANGTRWTAPAAPPARRARACAIMPWKTLQVLDPQTMEPVPAGERWAK